MAIYNLGSINIDYFYKAPHLLKAGETLAASEISQGLGGKVQINLLPAHVQAHSFTILEGCMRKIKLAFFLEQAGVDISHVQLDEEVPTGHAIIIIDEKSGENQILLMAGANAAIDEELLNKALAHAGPSDWALCQNETNLAVEFLTMAHQKGLSICYSAAPFVKERVLSVLKIVDLLVVNEIEAADIQAALSKSPEEWGVPHLIITRGAEGADYFGKEGQFHQAAQKVKAVDTTGAGDTYLGYLLGRLSCGDTMKQAMALAASAAAIQVTRMGTAEAIVSLSELKSLNKDG